MQNRFFKMAIVVATLDFAWEKEPGPGAICNWMTVPKWLGTTILNV